MFLTDSCWTELHPTETYAWTGWYRPEFVAGLILELFSTELINVGWETKILGKRLIARPQTWVTKVNLAQHMADEETIRGY
ncbi:hypothetical protein OAK85_02330 [Mariniblastus sp.]|nr:hypothetical protein [Mariniblastus sp.]